MATLSLATLLVTPMVGLLLALAAWRFPRAQALAALAAAAACLLATVGLFERVAEEPVRYAVAGWPERLGIVLVADPLSVWMLALTASLVLCATAWHYGQVLAGRDLDPMYPLGFPLLLQALNGLFLTGDLFNFYVFFELVAISSYLVVAHGRHHALEAAWKYALQSAVGSTLLLLGIALVYGQTGALSLGEIAARLDGPALRAAPFLLAAFLLKGAIFPFHWWQPDAHAAATTAGSVLLAGLLIKVGIYGILRVGPLFLGPELRPLLLGLGGAAILFGGVAAFRQADAKRLLGFSSISQLGFVLVGVGVGGAGGVAAALFFVLHHSLAKALLFLVTGALADRVGSTRIDDLALRARPEPWLAAAYLLAVLSLAGLPPTPGFVAKVALVREAVAVGAVVPTALVLTGGVATLGYGLRAFSRLFWATGPDAVAVRTPISGAVVIAALSASIVATVVAAGPLWRWCLLAARAVEAGP